MNDNVVVIQGHRVFSVRIFRVFFFFLRTGVFDDDDDDDNWSNGYIYIIIFLRSSSSAVETRVIIMYSSALFRFIAVRSDRALTSNHPDYAIPICEYYITHIAANYTIHYIPFFSFFSVRLYIGNIVDKNLVNTIIL